MRTLVLIASCALVLALSGTAQSVTYTITDLGTIGGSNAIAYGIDNSGQVVGIADTPDWYYHAFLWNGEAMTDLGLLDGTYAYARAINNGTAVGWADNVYGDMHAVLWQNGECIDIGTLGGLSSVAYDVNASGTVVGASDTQLGEYHAFAWTNGIMTDLGTLSGFSSQAFGVNSQGSVVGDSCTQEGEWHAVMWIDGAITDLGFPGSAHAINDSSQVTGVAYRDDGWKAFLYDNGQLTILTSLGGSYSTASDINSSGQIVGISSSADGATYACLWDNGSVTDLNSLLPPDSGWLLMEATAINDDGAVTGWGILGDQVRAFLLAPVKAIEVKMDIRPGDPANRIKLKDNTSVPVAIVAAPITGSTEWFDPRTIDKATVTLAGAPMDTKQKPQIHDVNGDLQMDLVLWFNTTDLQVQLTDTSARLDGETLDGRKIFGTDFVQIEAQKGKKTK